MKLTNKQIEQIEKMRLNLNEFINAYEEMKKYCKVNKYRIVTVNEYIENLEEIKGY